MTTEKFELDTKTQGQGLDYLRWLRDANQETGKGMGTMLREIASLMFGKGKIQPNEYFMYKLYDDQRYTPETKKTFLGRFGPIVQTPWADIVNDKQTLTALLRGLDLPTPKTQAIWHPHREFPGAVSLRNRDDVIEFLRENATYPVFGKPFDSVCSLGTANISRYDAQQDSLIMSGGQSIAVEAFVDQAGAIGTDYMFQTLMLPHPEITPIIGNRISTVRMFVLSDEEGCLLLRASWKIPAGDNGADNFWRPGNVLAGIDVETGKIVRVFQRTEAGDTKQIHEHPDTQANFDELVFPQWDAMRDTVLRAAANLPGCYFQGWDVALTDRGPVLVELEGDGGDPIMEQLCFDSGLLQGRYLGVLDLAAKREKDRLKLKKARKRELVKMNFAQLQSHLAEPDEEETDAPAEAALEPAEGAGDTEAKTDERELVGASSD